MDFSYSTISSSVGTLVEFTVSRVDAFEFRRMVVDSEAKPSQFSHAWSSSPGPRNIIIVGQSPERYGSSMSEDGKAHHATASQPGYFQRPAL